MNKIHVAILVSYRFECLNLYLDILKNNFDQNFITHVFCNLSTDTLKEYHDQIDHTLIDFFYPICDENCKEGINVSNGHKQEAKRKQPLEAISSIMSIMSNNDEIDNFIYTECDIYPVDSKKFLQPYFNIPDAGACVRYIPTFSGKLPSGYVAPGPLYISSSAAMALHKKLDFNKDTYLRAGISFEGMLGAAVNELANEGALFSVYSNYHTGNKTYEKDLEPVTMTTHQHNIFNLEGLFLDHNICEGRWVKIVLENNSMKMSWKTVDDSYVPGGMMLKTPGFKIDFMDTFKKS